MKFNKIKMLITLGILGSQSIVFSGTECLAQESVNKATDFYEVKEELNSFDALKKDNESVELSSETEKKVENKKVVSEEQITSKKTDDTKEAQVSKKTDDTQEAQVSKKTDDTQEVQVSKKTDDPKETQVSKKTDDTQEAQVSKKTDDTQEVQVSKKTDDTQEIQVSKKTDDTQEVQVSNETDDPKETQVSKKTDDPKEEQVSNETDDTQEAQVSKKTAKTKETQVSKKTDDPKEEQVSSETEDSQEEQATKHTDEVKKQTNTPKKIENNINKGIKPKEGYTIGDDIPALIDIFGNKIEDVQPIKDLFNPPNIIQHTVKNGKKDLNHQPNHGTQGEIGYNGKVLQLTDAKLTPDGGTSTSIWSTQFVSLDKPFSYESYIYLGKRSNPNHDIADGITFTLQADENGKNAEDQGMEGAWYAANGNLEGGYLGVNGYIGDISSTSTPALKRRINNSISFEFDTHLNPRNTNDKGSVDNDVISYLGPKPYKYNIMGSHMAFVKGYGYEMNGKDPVHEDLSFPKADLGDGKWHKIKFSWEPETKNSGKIIMETDIQVTYVKRDNKPESENPSIDNGGLSSKQEMYISDLDSVFNFSAENGEHEVAWGYTGATGGMSASSAIAVTKLPDDPEVNEKLAIKKRKADDEEYTADIQVANKEKLTLKVNNIVEDKEENIKVKKWENVTTSLRLPTGVTLDKESSQARIYKYKEGSNKKEEAGTANVSLVEEEGEEIAKVSVEGSVNGNDGYEPNQEIELDLVVEDMAKLEDGNKNMITGLAEGKNGVTKSEKPVYLELLDRQPVTVNYVYNNGSDDEYLPEEIVKSKTYTPEGEQESALVPTNLLENHFNYIENDLGLKEINDKGELTIPFNQKEQVVNLRYDGMTWLSSLEGGLSFKGKMQVEPQTLDQLTDHINMQVESTELEPNWQLKVSGTPFESEDERLPEGDNGLILNINNKVVSDKSLELFDEPETSSAKEISIGTPEGLPARLSVGPNSFKWVKPAKNYVTTLTWTLEDKNAESVTTEKQSLPLKEGAEDEQ
ncbi:lectin-like domain-containing protein [Vagococcus intermedius]|uniref:WxL domain-containing protein n=1 Tax=Vagococcus intermedius TaxID=2991418 RepID=A0AAF0CVP0_9ENTE|nr:hypothetical protein [Vagococcus intermedius]WEG73567.1 hypothetical protein OL234_01280 [Vagococcus intermedius]WEG75649.1 hypothetical protein OL235_01285 [Vagococcus intermedius]